MVSVAMPWPLSKSCTELNQRKKDNKYNLNQVVEWKPDKFRFVMDNILAPIGMRHMMVHQGNLDAAAVVALVVVPTLVADNLQDQGNHQEVHILTWILAETVQGRTVFVLAVHNQDFDQGTLPERHTDLCIQADHILRHRTLGKVVLEKAEVLEQRLECWGRTALPVVVEDTIAAPEQFAAAVVDCTHPDLGNLDTHRTDYRLGILDQVEPEQVLAHNLVHIQKLRNHNLGCKTAAELLLGEGNRRTN